MNKQIKTDLTVNQLKLFLLIHNYNYSDLGD